MHSTVRWRKKIELMRIETAIKMLKWPVLWRWAANWLSWREHDAGAATCPPCAAVARRRQTKHDPRVGFSRVPYCSKCGLAAAYWQRWPNCKGRPLLRHKVLTSPVVRSIMAWE